MVALHFTRDASNFGHLHLAKLEKSRDGVTVSHTASRGDLEMVESIL